MDLLATPATVARRRSPRPSPKPLRLAFQEKSTVYGLACMPWWGCCFGLRIAWMLPEYPAPLWTIHLHTAAMPGGSHSKFSGAGSTAGRRSPEPCQVVELRWPCSGWYVPRETMPLLLNVASEHRSCRAFVYRWPACSTWNIKPSGRSCLAVGPPWR